jgi:hypothetical protein
MHPVRRGKPLVILALAAIAAFASAGCGSPRHPRAAIPVPPMPMSLPNGWLNGVSAPTGSTAWAVGFTCKPGCGLTAASERTLVVRWQGGTWSRTPSASPGLTAALNSVSAAADGTAWAVGQACISKCDTTSKVERPLILRWDGARWAQTASGSTYANLLGVSVGADGTAWAVGASCVSSCGAAGEIDRPLALHFDGTAWSETASPSPGVSAQLEGVSAGPDGSAWAVGYVCTGGCGSASAALQPLILRWDGTSWTQAASPGPAGVSLLSSVSAGPDGTGWAVGQSCVSGCGTTAGVARTLILYWNGTSWSQVTSPNPYTVDVPDDVSAGPGGTAWATAESCASACGTTTEADRTLILHWDGSRWSQVPSPSPDRVIGLRSVSADPSGGAWAVGLYCMAECGTSAQLTRTLILHWNGTTWAVS